jgi:serine protease AprX
LVDWPAALPEAIAVGAYDPLSGEVAPFSSPGAVRLGDPKPDVLAPGVCIASPRTRRFRRSREDFFAGSGTSFATPLVAGLVALMLEVDPNLDREDARLALTDLVVHDFQPAPNHRYGYGKLFQR